MLYSLYYFSQEHTFLKRSVSTYVWWQELWLMHDGKSAILYPGWDFEPTSCVCSFGHMTDSITSHGSHGYIIRDTVQRGRSFPVSAAILGDTIFKLPLIEHLLCSKHWAKWIAWISFSKNSFLFLVVIWSILICELHKGSNFISFFTLNFPRAMLAYSRSTINVCPGKEWEN